ncbi:MAG: amidase [Sphingomonadales bacterium]|nr:amidase [Sphingomonadales bacterium]
MGLAECLARIDARDEAVRGWTYLDRAAVGGPGPLSGVVLGVKDVIDVAGMPTTHGSPAFAGNVAAADAECVARLRRAGAVVLGKTVTAEFATYSPGPTRNPWNPGHTPGGSSSGSAAVVADGQADIAFGTQTAGSMIRPASFCGTIGFKPTFGRYPDEGCLATAHSLDTIGLFARTIDLLDRADAAVAAEPATPAANPALRVGLCRTPMWPEAGAAMQHAFGEFAAHLAAAGYACTEVELPASYTGLIAAQTLIHRREAWMLLSPIRAAHEAEVTQAFRDFLDAGARESEADYQAALALQQACRAELDAVFAGVDVLLAPSAPGIAPAGLGSTGNPVFQRIWTALGVPCLGFPAAWSEGLPLGLTLVGRPGADRQLIADARAIVALGQFKEPL